MIKAGLGEMKIKKIIMAVFLFLLVPLTACGDEKERQFNHAPDEFFSDPAVVALAIAALDNEEQKVKSLIQQGVNVNYQGKDGMTPLLWVLGQQNPKGFGLLLQTGANPNAPIKTGGSAMTFAARADNPVYLKMALEQGGDPNYFHRHRKHSLIFDAISPGHLEHVKLLVRHGADINATDAIGVLPIMRAASLNQYDIVYYLLEEGADFRQENRWGNTITYFLENSNISKDSELYLWRAKVVAFLRNNGVEVKPRED